MARSVPENFGFFKPPRWLETALPEHFGQEEVQPSFRISPPSLVETLEYIDTNLGEGGGGKPSASTRNVLIMK